MTGRLDLTSEHVERISTCGYTILEGAIEPELIGALTARIDALLDELSIPFGDNTFLGT
jgi:hypothetical protein